MSIFESPQQRLNRQKKMLEAKMRLKELPPDDGDDLPSKCHDECHLLPPNDFALYSW